MPFPPNNFMDQVHTFGGNRIPPLSLELPAADPRLLWQYVFDAPHLGQPISSPKPNKTSVRHVSLCGASRALGGRYGRRQKTKVARPDGGFSMGRVWARSAHRCALSSRPKSEKCKKMDSAHESKKTRGGRFSGDRRRSRCATTPG